MITDPTIIGLVFPFSLGPLFSNRQHYHIDVCLEDNREDIRTIIMLITYARK